MRKFVIVTDSCSDLSKDLRDKYNVEYVQMHVIIDEKEYMADIDFNEIPYHDFYELMRNGTRITTAQVTALEFEAKFEEYVKNDLDVLYISCSGTLSASIKASIVAKNAVLQRHPEAKIICVDSLNSCFGLGIMCMVASEKRDEGMTIEEVANWLEENKLTVNQECTVEKLTYLKQAGRVSAAKAFFGGLLNKKPIIISDALGRNHALETVKGRRASMERIADRMKEEILDVPHQKIVVCHADDEEAGKELQRIIESRFPDKKLDIYLGKIGPIIGSSAGPGTIAVYFFGKEVTVNKPE